MSARVSGWCRSEIVNAPASIRFSIRSFDAPAPTEYRWAIRNIGSHDRATKTSVRMLKIHAGRGTAGSRVAAGSASTVATVASLDLSEASGSPLAELQPQTAIRNG